MNREILEIILRLKDQLTPGVQKAAQQGSGALNNLSGAAKGATSAVDRLADSLKPGSTLDAGVLKQARAQDALSAGLKNTSNNLNAVSKSATKTNQTILKSIVRFGKFLLGIGATAFALNALKRAMGSVINASVELGVKQAELEGKTFAYKDATDRLTESHKMFLASVGDFLTRNPAVVSALNVLSELFLELADANIAARDEMGDLVGTGFVELVDGALQVARAINGIIRTLNLATQTVLRMGIGFNNAAIAVDSFFHVTTPQAIIDLTPRLESMLADAEAAILVLDAGTDAIIAAQDALNNISVGGGAPIGRDILERGTGGGAASTLESVTTKTKADILRAQQAILDVLAAENIARKDKLQEWIRIQDEAARTLKDKMIVFAEIQDVLNNLAAQREIAQLIDRRRITSAFDPTGAEGLLFQVSGGQKPKKGEGRFGGDFLQNALGAGIGGFAGGGGRGAIQSILPLIGSAFGPIGGAIGGLVGGLLGKKKRGEVRSNPVFVEEVKKGDQALALLNIFKGSGAAGGGRTINDINNLIRGGGATLGFSSAPS